MRVGLRVQKLTWLPPERDRASCPCRSPSWSSRHYPISSRPGDENTDQTSIYVYFLRHRGEPSGTDLITVAPSPDCKTNLICEKVTSCVFSFTHVWSGHQHKNNCTVFCLCTTWMTSAAEVPTRGTRTTSMGPDWAPRDKHMTTLGA